MVSNPATFRVAIIGAGPAGLFTAEELLRAKRPVSIELFERLPHPHGLVRYGVAPDHPNTRRIGALLDRTAAQPSVTLRLNTEVGRDFTIEQLRAKFDAVVVATGAEEDRALAIPGEHLPGVHSSLSFAGWVNGHPDFASAPIALDAETAVIIGNGNVALDIARLLAREPAALRATDIAPAARDALERSGIKRIHVIGRRGPAQAAFGENEIQEFGTLPGVAFRIDPVVAFTNPEDDAELADPRADRARAVVRTLRELASRPAPADARITVGFDFLRRPIGISGAERVEGITLELCRLEGEPGSQRSVPTGALQRLPCGVVFAAIGHRGCPLPGLPFDPARGVIPTRDHRVLDGDQPLKGVYAVGWIKRGATGLIGHNRRDAMETVKAIWADAPAPG